MSITNIEIIVGTYEEFLLGYKVQKTEIKKYKLVQSFANRSHRGSIRCVAASGKYLASGGADDTIYLYDLKTRKECGMLMHHNGTVHCVTFSPTGSHLLTGSEDGNLTVCRTGNWQMEKIWGAAHKGSAVTSMSVHPSGKLLLTLGTDGTLRTWNLVKGRKAYVTNLGKDSRWSSGVIWSPEGNYYIVLPGGKRANVYSVETAGIEKSVQTEWGVCCACFLSPDIFCLAGEEGNVALYSLSKKNCDTMAQLVVHKDRVKAVGSVSLSNGSTWLVTSSSAGQIKLWQFKDDELQEICSTETGCRITCLILVDNSQETPSEKEDTELEIEDNTQSASDTEPEILLSSKSKKRVPEIGEVVIEVDNSSRKRKKHRSKKKKDTASDDNLNFAENGNMNVQKSNTKSERTRKRNKVSSTSSGQWSVQDG